MRFNQNYSNLLICLGFGSGLGIFAENAPQWFPETIPETFSTERPRISLACHSCNRFKLKCSLSRPCESCKRRGTECVEKPTKPRACIECKSRKIRCNFDQPCWNCVKHDRRCRQSNQYSHSSTAGSLSPSTVESMAAPPNAPEAETQPPNAFDDPFDFAGVWSIDSLAHTDGLEEPLAFDLSAFEFDNFPTVTPFWPDPSFQSPLANPLFHGSSSPDISFDDFDRSRILHDLNLVPLHCRGDLPSSTRLTTILRQYFQFVDPYTPCIHISSFSVKGCPTPYLLLLLAIGDVYSSNQSLERWARKAFRHLARREVDLFEN